jgi:hypothetical protein
VGKAFKKVTANNGASITVCPKCEKEYLKTAWMLENRKYKLVGHAARIHIVIILSKIL